jgi:hypothetical protein
MPGPTGMKTGTIVLAIMMLLPIGVGFSSQAPLELQPATEPSYAPAPSYNKYHVLEMLTVYHPEEGQCDETPLITANNSHIDLGKLVRNEIRWMALSRNLLKRWNGEFNYGDTVVLQAGDPDIDGLWVINDSMNKRFKDRGDLLVHKENRTTGMWKGVRISRWDRKPLSI